MYLGHMVGDRKHPLSRNGGLHLEMFIMRNMKMVATMVQIIMRMVRMLVTKVQAQ